MVIEDLLSPTPPALLYSGFDISEYDDDFWYYKRTNTPCFGHGSEMYPQDDEDFLPSLIGMGYEAKDCRECFHDNFGELGDINSHRAAFQIGNDLQNVPEIFIPKNGGEGITKVSPKRRPGLLK